MQRGCKGFRSQTPPQDRGDRFFNGHSVFRRCGYRSSAEPLKKKYGFSVAGGQDRLKGKIIRIGHMGYMDFGDLIAVIGALELSLQEAGYQVELGRGVAAALKVFAEGGMN